VFKSLSLLSFLFVLTLSILPPSEIVSINQYSHVTMAEFINEEGESNQEKESDGKEVEDEKKEHFFSLLMALNNTPTINITPASIAVVEDVSSYSLDIQLPPPKYYI